MIEIQRNEVHLWCVHDQEITDDALLQLYQALLNTEEKARWQRFKFPQHRHQFLVTRALVRSVLAQYLNIKNPSDIIFKKNEYGKPALVVPNQASTLQFNLSHTDQFIVLAISLESELGVDVETISRKAEILKLAQRYFSPVETEALMDLNEEQQNQRFFDLWTLKEAYIKACGKGLALPLHDFSYEFAGKHVGISFSDALNDRPEVWQFWQFTLSEKHQLALALKEETEKDCSVTWRKGIPLQQFNKFTLEAKRKSFK